MNPRFQYRTSRRGITLTEVLISMFVLLIGLMGVGAMIPAGRYEIMQGVKADYAAMVGREAYRDMKVRGWLDPTNWRDSIGSTIVIPVASGPNVMYHSPTAWCIDPLGLNAGFGGRFPYGASSTIGPPLGLPPGLIRIYPNPYLNTKLLADSLFRCQDDLTIVGSTLGKDRPPVQQSIPYNQDPLNPLNPILARSSEGNYSWIATIVPDPSAPSNGAKMTVSVAVLYKRDLSTPATAEIQAAAALTTLTMPPVWNGELTITISSGMKPLRPGDWFLLAGNAMIPNPDMPRTPPVAPPQVEADYYRWFRVFGATEVTSPPPTPQYITVHGGDWNPNLANLQAWIVPNVIAVYEKNIRLESN